MELSPTGKLEVPTLVDLCVQTAIDNVKYLGDVGETDFYLLDRILPHCTLEQLQHIEDCTEGRDLSPVTDKLWKRFYEIRFPIEKMKQMGKTSKWKIRYQASVREENEKEEKSVRYAEAEAKKQSRKIQICSKVPPSSKKRGGGPNIGNTKSSLMKKSRLEFLNWYRRVSSTFFSNSMLSCSGSWLLGESDQKVSKDLLRKCFQYGFFIYIHTHS